MEQDKFKRYYFGYSNEDPSGRVAGSRNLRKDDDSYSPSQAKYYSQGSPVKPIGRHVSNPQAINNIKKIIKVPSNPYFPDAGSPNMRSILKARGVPQLYPSDQQRAQLNSTLDRYGRAEPETVFQEMKGPNRHSSAD